jgi:hypothetical protein
MSRELILRRRLKQPKERAAPGETICELSLNGETYPVVNKDRADHWGIYQYFVEEGQEIPLDGELFEYSDSGSIAPSPSPQPGIRRKLSYRRRSSYPKIFLNYRREDSEQYAWRLQET